ncbi:PREDICTED: BTB/POZ domain-containing protein At5g67385-like isoform X2 [Brassica oleracea var. oleracea]|uniref:BTB domain-containing protein n=1 Tax=Brassica oleracea var. oleracea TaxID=109376 RepID=A0A0D3DRS9_BRAOL|nr:PREDICTED: BTB/POZ domain-containing protein At5g67385-like isoform X2 [Brassica oleracea var. oleracea]
MSAKRKELLSLAMERTSEWISSQEIPSDITVHIGDTSFSLHKILLSKCGFIKKLTSESSNDSNITVIKIPDFPGGAEAFDLAIKSCYGINLEMNAENIAMLRCAAEYLDMTEEHSVANLVETTEVYLNEVILKSLPSSVKVLQRSEGLVPMAERVKLVSRCIDAIAYATCQESQNKEDVVDLWAEDLSVLRIDMFQRVLIAMMARGFKQHTLGPVLMLYAQKALRGLEISGRGAKKIEMEQEQEKRVILETIVSLLPRGRNAVSVSFLSMLLRAALYLETTVACRLDLEKRMGLHLRQAVLDDLLIPSFNGDNTMFDVDTVQRILMNYLEFEVEGNTVDFATDIGELMESYLAEVASDRNINLVKFMGIAECIPEQSRIKDDGIYRAIDMYLKVHPNISEVEKKKICSLMNSQKLSQEACAHVAQNKRLPVHIVAQVLHQEQQSLRQVLCDSDSPVAATAIAPESPPPPTLSSYNNELSKLNRENQDLKLELLKVKLTLKELEREKDFEMKSCSDCSSVSTASVVKSPLRRKSFISSVSRKLGKLNPFGHTQGRTMTRKGRRHSIS